MKFMEMAPDRGIFYALYQDRMEFHRYTKDQLPSEEKIAEGLLELHLFDTEREYRYINKRKGQIELCVDDNTVVHDDCYEEVIYTLDLANEEEHVTLDTARNKVGVVNYITYNEDDLMVISNYRLKEVHA